MPSYLFALLLTLFGLVTGPEPNSATTSDTGSGLDPNG